ncbi:MAG: GNAT family N-acetyltransferase [Methylococcales bacterium]|nr:GNAT family N-acetyltransferase [Methylococcales bacterium]
MEPNFKLIDKANIEIILPLLHQLDSSIPKFALETRLSEMVENGYVCLGIYLEDELIGICGIWKLIKYYVGRHLELDNVYIKEEYRYVGFGKQLDTWLKNYAISCGYDAIELNCYIHNEQGNKYWIANGYNPIGIHYQKKLDN